MELYGDYEDGVGGWVWVKIIAPRMTALVVVEPQNVFRRFAFNSWFFDNQVGISWVTMRRRFVLAGLE